MTTKTAHTPGAVKAAEKILGQFGKVHDQWRMTTAEIIDRETAAPEMLEALELCKQALFNPYRGEKSESRKGIATKAWEVADAAIKKARGR